MRSRATRPRLAAAAEAFASTARSADLRRAQGAFAGAWVAEWAFSVGLAVYAFRVGGPAAVGLVTVLRMVPAAIVAQAAAPLVDRWRREHVLVAVSAVRAAATAVAALVAWTDGPAVVVYLAAMASTVAATLYRPAHSALLPSLCRTPYELTSANVVRGLLDSLGTLAGPLVAAVLLEVSGVTAVFVAAALASAWSSLVMRRVRGSDAVPPGAGRPLRVRADVVEGFRAVAVNRDLRLLVGLAAAQTLTRGALTVLIVVLAIGRLGVGESGAGTLTAAVGAGAVVGSVAASLLVGSRGLARWFGAGVALWGAPLAVLATSRSELATVLLLTVIGVGNALVDAGLFTLMARLAPDAVLGRAFAVLESIIALSVGAGSVVASLLVDRAGLSTALVAVGVLAPALVLLSWPRLRRLDTTMVVRDREVGLLRAVPMFAPLPLPALEQLARGLEQVSVPPGAAVVVQGDPADRFYLIEDGTAVVLGDDRPVAVLGPGDVFGEVALLRRVPRTATVRARTALRLQSLTRDRFLSVVTASPSSVREVTGHVDDLLERYNPSPPVRPEAAGD